MLPTYDTALTQRASFSGKAGPLEPTGMEEAMGAGIPHLGGATDDGTVDEVVVFFELLSKVSSSTWGLEADVCDFLDEEFSVM
jgi:hypothetical protein